MLYVCVTFIAGYLHLCPCRDERTGGIADTGLGESSGVASLPSDTNLVADRAGGGSLIGSTRSCIYDNGSPFAQTIDVSSAVMPPQANVAWFGFHICPRHSPYALWDCV